MGIRSVTFGTKPEENGTSFGTAGCEKMVWSRTRKVPQARWAAAARYAHAMSPAAAQRARTRAKKSRKRKRAGWLAWLPLLLAIAVKPFEVRAASVLALTGPGALRLLFPFVVLVQAHAPASLAPEQRDTLAEWAMWAQFPVYGLLMALAARWRSFLFGAGLLVVVHAAAIVAATVPAMVTDH